MTSEIVKSIWKVCVEEESTNIEMDMPSQPLVIFPGIHILIALQQILFPKSFQRLPNDIKDLLSRQDAYIELDEQFMSKITRLYQPLEDHMYCRSEKELTHILNTIVGSQAIHRMHPSMGITIFRSMTGSGKMQVKKTMIPAYVVNAFTASLRSSPHNNLMKLIYKFEFEKLAHDTTNTESVELDFDNLKNVFFQQMTGPKIIKTTTEEVARFWKKHAKVPIGKAIISVIDHCLNGYEYPFKTELIEELREYVMIAEKPMEKLKEIFFELLDVKKITARLFASLPVECTRSYWDIPDKPMQEVMFDLHTVKYGSFEPTQNNRSFVFCRDVELGVMMAMKRKNVVDMKKHWKNWMAMDTDKIFNYISYDAVCVVMNKVCSSEGYYKHQITEMYGYNTCPPLLSPINTRCKQAEVILRDFFNILNYELDLFRSIREENFKDFHAFIVLFCKEFELHRKSQFCISLDHFNKFLDENRPKLLTMMEPNAKKMVVLNDQAYDGPTMVSLLTPNVKPGLLRGYELLLKCAAESISTETSNWTKLADDILFRAFVVEYPQLCYLMHNQQQCSIHWNDCLLQIHEQPGTYCDITTINHSYGYFESQYAQLLEESLPVKKVRKPKPVKKIDSIEKAVEFRSSSEEVKEEMSRAASDSHDVPEVVEVPTIQPSQNVVKRESVTPIEKKDIVLYNSDIIIKSLKIICDPSIYDKVLKRKYFIRELPKGWVEFEEVSKLLEKVSGVLEPSVDFILKEIQQLRQLPVAPMLFEIGTKLIDFKNPNRLKMSREERRTRFSKSNLLKCLPISEKVYQKDDAIFNHLLEHLLDISAQKIGKYETVTLRCPKYELMNMMEELKSKIRENRKEQTMQFIEMHRDSIGKLETDDKKIDYLISILTATDKVSDYFRKEMTDLLENFKLNVNSEKWMWKVLTRKMKQEEFEKLKDMHQEHIKKMDTNDSKIEYLINVLSGTDHTRLIDSLKSKRKIWIDIVLSKIHKAQRVVETLCQIDNYGITRKFDKDTINHIPVVRAVGNNPLFFVNELRIGFEVAHRLRNDGVELDETNLPEDDHNYCDSFCYVNKEQLDIISKNEGFYELPFEEMSTDQISLKSNVIIPVWSPNNTPCVEAGLVLKHVLKNLTTEKIFARLQSTDITKLSNYVEHLCRYFKPTIFITFCLDYHKSMELINDKCAKFGNLKNVAQTNYKSKTAIKKVIEMESKLRAFPSFELMLSSLLSDYESLPSADTLTEIFDIADLRTFMFEYIQMAIVYHNQKLCMVTGKKPFCSISLIEGDNLVYEIPAKCNIPSTGHVEAFKNMLNARNITRLVRGDVEDVIEAEDVDKEDENVIVDKVEDSEREEDAVPRESSQESEMVESSDGSLDDDIETINDMKFELSIIEESDQEEAVEEVEIEKHTKIVKHKEKVVESSEPFDPASFIECSSNTFIVKNSRTYEESKASESATFKTPNSFTNNADHGQMFAPVYQQKPTKSINFSNHPSTSKSSENPSSKFYDRPSYHPPTPSIKPTSLFELCDYLPKNENALHQKIRKLEQEVEKLDWKLNEAIVDRDEWKEKYEDFKVAQHQKKEIIDINYCKKYIDRGEKMKKAAMTMLKERSADFSNAADMIRAEEEFEDFEQELKIYTRKAFKNISILKADPNTPTNSLFKLVEWSDMFSETTLEKMKQLCFICTEEMDQDQKSFNCVQCTAEAHYDCYAKCPTTKCPICCKPGADRNDFPPLSTKPHGL